MTESMVSGYGTLRVEVEGPLALVSLHRPEALNAISNRVLDDLGRFLEVAAGPGSAVRAVVVTGSGDKAFAAGADIGEMKDFTAEQAFAFARKGQGVLDRIAAFPGVTIAAVNGFALGGGCELAMAFDLVVAARNAVFGQPEVNLGVIPGFGGTQRLVRRVGLQRATELVLTGRRVKADEALELGLCLQVVDEGQAVAASREIARTVLDKGPVAVRLAKQALQAGSELDLPRGLEHEAALFGLCFATADQREGMAAFFDKRKAAFTGR